MDAATLIQQENLWAQPYAPQYDGPAFEEARAQASRDLLAAGAPVFNEWCATMKALEALKKSSPEAERAWDALSVLDVRDATFEGGVDIAGCIIPNALWIRNAQIHGDFYLDGSRVLGSFAMLGCAVLGTASFQNVMFSEGATFREVQFARRSDFSSALMLSDFEMTRCVFGKDVWFRAATFSGAAMFDETTFKSDAGFHHATFAKDVSFARATFEDNLGFEETTFEGGVEVSGASVGRRLWTTDAQFARPRDAVAVQALTQSAGAVSRPALRVIAQNSGERKKGA